MITDKNKTLNKVKKFLGIRKKDLILQQVFKQYNREFYDNNSAVKFMLKVIEKSEITNN